MNERQLVSFSTEATDLMAHRAQRSLSTFAEMTEEFRDLEVTPVAKIGYVVDGGGPNDREHMWFEVHGVGDDGIDATLFNEPFNIERLSAGQRGTHPVELLSDWLIATPLGPISPRNLQLARQLRELRPRILEALREQSA